MSASDPIKDGNRGSATGQQAQTGGERLVVQPPLAVPLDAEHEQAAIDALAELLATWRERHADI